MLRRTRLRAQQPPSQGFGGGGSGTTSGGGSLGANAAPGKAEPYGKPMMGTGQSKAEPSPDAMYHAGAEKLQTTLNQLKNREWKHRYTVPYWRAAFAANAGGTLILGAVGISAFCVAMPWIFYQWQEILGFDVEMLNRDRVMPPHTPPWWLNEWRKHLTPWKAAESWQENPSFHLRGFEWIYRCTGRDKLHPHANNQKKLEQDASREKTAKPKLHDPFDPNNKSECPRAFVPLCGDSPIVKILAAAGYEVDGLDCADLAVRELSDRLEVAFATEPETLSRIHLHLQDIFAPHAWKNETGIVDSKEAFDFIWDRQGLSAIDPDRRQDYAFLLKKSLTPTGTIYVEGSYRTAKRHDNREMGPPFHFGEAELEDLFPRSQGFRVKCTDMRELTIDDLDPESKVTGIVPEFLLARSYPCCVWKDEALVKEMKVIG